MSITWNSFLSTRSMVSVRSVEAQQISAFCRGLSWQGSEDPGQDHLRSKYEKNKGLGCFHLYKSGTLRRRDHSDLWQIEVFSRPVNPI